MKNIFASLLISAILMTALSTYAQPNKCGMNPQGNIKLFKELNLTDQQKDEIAKLRSEHQKQAIDLKADIQKLRIEIKDQLREKNLNEDKILSITKKISDLQAQLKESAVKTWLDSYKLLDEKQKETWKEHAPMLLGDRHMIDGKMRGRKMFRDMQMDGDRF
jgi:Spy/CpxP family protein refolding chaperone